MITFSTDSAGRKWEHVRRHTLEQINIEDYREGDGDFEIELYDMQCADCGTAVGFVEGQWVPTWVLPGTNAVEPFAEKFCEECLEYDQEVPSIDSVIETLLGMVDKLEPIAKQHRAEITLGIREQWNAQTCLDDAVANLKSAVRWLNESELLLTGGGGQV